jgi:hypothetical protein
MFSVRSGTKIRNTYILQQILCHRHLHYLSLLSTGKKSPAWKLYTQPEHIARSGDECISGKTLMSQSAVVASTISPARSGDFVKSTTASSNSPMITCGTHTLL